MSQVAYCLYYGKFTPTNHGGADLFSWPGRRLTSLGLCVYVTFGVCRHRIAEDTSKGRSAGTYSQVQSAEHDWSATESSSAVFATETKPRTTRTALVWQNA